MHKYIKEEIIIIIINEKNDKSTLCCKIHSEKNLDGNQFIQVKVKVEKLRSDLAILYN